jgi:hypothetical protein
MSDAPESSQTPPPEETKSAAPADETPAAGSPSTAGESPATAPAPESAAPQPPASAASETPPEGAAPEQPGPAAEGEAKPEAPSATAEGEAKPEAQTQEAPKPEAPAGPPVYYDGLDSGLAWFGAPPFIPPLPAGYPAPVKEAPEAEAPAGERVVVSRKGVRERFEAKRQETESAKTWYQKVPIPVWVTMPAMLFILVWIGVVAQPWKGTPGPKETQKVDAALLDSPPVEGQAAELRAKGVDAVTPPIAYRLLANGVLAMSSRMDLARVTFDVPEGLGADYEVACDIAFLDPGSHYESWFLLGDRAGIGLVSDPVISPKPFVSTYRFTDRLMQRQEPYRVKPDYWYRLRILVKGGNASYMVDNHRVGTVLSVGATPRKVILSMQQARGLVRDWAFKPLK